MPVETSQPITNRILAHYGANARDLPWRSAPETAPPAPYRVWLSEIMLQQTTVAAVKPYFDSFVARWPTVGALAAADDADIMAAWAGLGYYSRARNLIACARRVAETGFPEDEAELLALPGIGPYTAAAIASIAFGKRAVVVDGNVERVVARFYAVERPIPAAKPELKALADDLTPSERAGDFAQAMMDLGATICTPRNPACAICPLVAECKGKGDPLRYPVKTPKRAKPRRMGTAWWVERNGDVLLVRRPEKGLLGGMMALPSDDWNELPRSGDANITHVFTHFTLDLVVIRADELPDHVTASYPIWWPIDRLDEAGLPSLFTKAARAVQGK